MHKGRARLVRPKWRKFWLTALIVAVALFTMFTEYRIIMTHQQITQGENGTIYATIFGFTDAYKIGG